MLFEITTILFLTIVLIIYYLCPARFRRIVLILSSIYYLGSLSIFSLIHILIITIVCFFAGQFMQVFADNNEARSAKLLFISTVSILIIFLFSWKYLPWIHTFGIWVPKVYLDKIIPIGLSFYTFQAISYLADVKMGKTKACKNLMTFTTYMIWFPKLTSGPIERYPEFKERLYDSKLMNLFRVDCIKKGFSFIMPGIFMKLVIADRLGLVVDMVYETPEDYGRLAILLTVILYSLQIYCDFAGYTYIICGISELFGISLTPNFKTPYLATNIKEFWRCWHISLSSFYKDYVYIPLGGSKKGDTIRIRNVMIVFILCGMWHGAGPTFLIWGLLHGIYNLLNDVFKKYKLDILIKGPLGIVLTFSAVTLAWIFFEFWMPDNIYGMEFSLNKVDLMISSCNKEQINKYFPSFAGYHNRYSELEDKDYELLDIPEEDLAEFKGYNPYFDLNTVAPPETNITAKTPIPPKSKDYLQKIIDYTSAHDIELMLVVNPYPSTAEDEMVYNSIEEMAISNNIAYVNMNKSIDAIGLKADEHYNDDSHLNYQGSCVFSYYLGSYIKDNYVIEDHRGDEDYETWDAFSDRVENANIDVLR